MSDLLHLDGITSRMITTSRGRFHLLESGPTEGKPVFFVHGNVSSSTFWEETMLALPEGYRAIAPDMRGYGESEQLPVDATRGMRDLSDDIHSIIEAMGITQFFLVGHSLGGNVTLQYTIDHAPNVKSLTLVAPGSPYGYGGTKDVSGTPCWPDYAGSGGGIVHPEIISRLATRDQSTESEFSPRSLLRNRFVKPPFISLRENMLVEAMLRTSTNEWNYSRDLQRSSNWPNVAPGTKGVNNAISPKYCNLENFANIDPKPPVMWVRGTDDEIVSDTSPGEPGTLGSMGLFPGWPGNDIYPPQPMVSQTRAVLERYKARGGLFQECILSQVGHVPHLEDPAVFLAIWIPFLQERF